MKLTVVIPGKNQDQTIKEFRIRPDTKDVTAVMIVDGKRQPVSFSMQDAIDNATASQKNVVKGFFKILSKTAYEKMNEALALSVDTANIDGDLFDDV